MRVEPYAVDSYLHVVKRGARGMPIVRDEKDRLRFARLLYFMNDKHKDENWDRGMTESNQFERPEFWPDRVPLVKVVAWTLMPNHFHLLLKEIREGGISKFMQKFCNSMSSHFNRKYKETGSIFQGSYRSRTVADDNYMRYVAAYIMVKNVFELYPGGYKKAVVEFDRAWKWAVESYAFSSLPEYAGFRNQPIIEKDILGEIFESPEKFKEDARDMILGRIKLDKLDEFE